MEEKDVAQVPFFAHFLESQEKVLSPIGRSLKFPSDTDED